MPLDIETMHRWVTDYGPLAVGVGSSMDNTGVPIFFVVGLAAAEAAKVRPEAMWVAAFLGSIAGDMGTYCIGRYFLTKDRILNDAIGQRMAPMIHAGQDSIGRWGIWTLVFGRFVPYVGKVLPLLAGSYRMSWVSTTVSVIVGSFLLTGFFYVFAEAALLVVTGHASKLKAVSLVLGAATVGGLWWYNSMLKARGQIDSR
jgi:membrane protein DedA with SNARE-associated domain